MSICKSIAISFTCLQIKIKLCYNPWVKYFESQITTNTSLFAYYSEWINARQYTMPMVTCHPDKGGICQGFLPDNNYQY
jgi:hypothetical protein